MLWGLIGKPNGAIPTDPADDDVNQFGLHFTNDAQILAQGRPEATALIEPAVVVIPTWDSTRAHTSAELRQNDIPEVAFGFMKTTIAKYALTCFAPDLRQASYSLYNQACRMAAIDSFRQMVQAGVYVEFNVEKNKIHQVDLMTAVYDHTVHVAKRREWKAEMKKPGSAKRNENLDKARKARKRVCCIGCFFFFYTDCSA